MVLVCTSGSPPFAFQEDALGCEDQRHLESFGESFGKIGGWRWRMLWPWVRITEGDPQTVVVCWYHGINHIQLHHENTRQSNELGDATFRYGLSWGSWCCCRS